MGPASVDGRAARRYTAALSAAFTDESTDRILAGLGVDPAVVPATSRELRLTADVLPGGRLARPVSSSLVELDLTHVAGPGTVVTLSIEATLRIRDARPAVRVERPRASAATVAPTPIRRVNTASGARVGSTPDAQGAEPPADRRGARRGASRSSRRRSSPGRFSPAPTAGSSSPAGRDVSDAEARLHFWRIPATALDPTVSVALTPTTGVQHRHPRVARPTRTAALGGADTVHGLGGADPIGLGAGADRASGGPGRDRILGRAAVTASGAAGAPTSCSVAPAATAPSTGRAATPAPTAGPVPADPRGIRCERASGDRPPQRCWRGAMALGGCVGIYNGFSEQLDVVGNLQIKQELCASGSPGCPPGVGGPSGDLPVQVLLGFRIPTGSTPPATFTSTGPEALAFAQSPGYTAELERLAPTDASQKWVGYITGVVNYTTTGVQRAIVQPRFALDRGADGSPFPGPYPHRPVVGFRLVSASLPAERPVTCGAALNADSGDSSICVDDPALAAVATDFQRDTRDLGVLAAGPVSAPRGSLATVPFTLRYAGPAGTAANFSLAATTTLPGATAVPNPPTLAPPANSDTVIPVAVGVPPSAAPGGYDVTFTARLANGQVRTGTRRLNVTSAPPGGVAGPAGRRGRG